MLMNLGQRDEPLTFGQVIYQTLAPEIVRRSTREQFVREKRDEYVKQPSRDLLEAADLALDRNTHQQLSFPRFVYYYPPVENIIKTEALIGEAIKTANRINEDSVKKLRSLFIKCVKDGSDYATREAFYRISRSKLYSYDNYLARLDIPYSTKEHWDHLFTEINLVIDSIGYTNLDNLLHNTAKVGYAADLNYMMEANRRFPIMLLASILYLTAVGLILVIMGDQIGAVLTAAGWW